MGRREETLCFAPPRRHRMRGCLLWLLFFAAVCLGAVMVVNLSQQKQVRLIKQPVSVLGLPQELEGFSILHISDLHGALLGEGQAMIQTAIGTASYKAVCITGDMVGKDGDYRPFLQLLSLLKQDVPILFIPGDEDPDPVFTAAHDTLNVLASYITAAQAAGAVYLDAPYPLAVGKTTLWFSPEGLYTVNAETTIASCQSQLDKLNALNTAATPDGEAERKALEYRLDAAQRLLAARAQMKSTDLHIALTHAPLTYEYVRSVWEWDVGEGPALKDVTLALAGHLCGGQYRLPGAGALYVPGYGLFPEDSLITGFARVSTIAQYVSPGLGSSGFYPLEPGRLFNPPTITLVTLTGKPQ